MIASQPRPSAIALARSALVVAFAVNAAAALARVHADASDLGETSATPTLVRCYAVVVVAILATRHASTSVSRRCIRGNRSRLPASFSSFPDVRPLEDESVVAPANFRRDARAVVARRADGLAAARRVLVAVEARAQVRRVASAVAAIEAANRFAREQYGRVGDGVTDHAVAVFADAEAGRLADSVLLAGSVADRIALVRGARGRPTVALVATAYVGPHADAVLAARTANWLAVAREIALGVSVTGFAGAFVRRAAVPVDAVARANRFAHVRRAALGRTVALVARASFGPAAEAVDAGRAADRLAYRVIGEISRILKELRHIFYNVNVKNSRGRHT